MLEAKNGFFFPFLFLVPRTSGLEPFAYAAVTRGKSNAADGCFPKASLEGLLDEHVQLAFVLHMAGRHLRVGITAPKEVGSACTFDGAAGILIYHKPGKGHPSFYFTLRINNGFLCPDKAEGSFGKQP